MSQVVCSNSEVGKSPVLTRAVVSNTQVGESPINQIVYSIDNGTKIIRRCHYCLANLHSWKKPIRQLHLKLQNVCTVACD